MPSYANCLDRDKGKNFYAKYHTHTKVSFRIIDNYRPAHNAWSFSRKSPNFSLASSAARLMETTCSKAARRNNRSKRSVYLFSCATNVPAVLSETASLSAIFRQSFGKCNETPIAFYWVVIFCIIYCIILSTTRMIIRPFNRYYHSKCRKSPIIVPAVTDSRVSLCFT